MSNLGAGTQLKKKKGWSTSGHIGPPQPNPYAVAGAPTASTGNQVSLQAHFEDEPDDYTISFATQPDAGSPAYAAQALVRVSVEGSSITRLIDVDNGASITVVAQAVNVIVFNVPLATGSTPGYTVYIQVTKGTRGSFDNPPRLTSYIPIGTQGPGQPNALFQYQVAATSETTVVIPTGPNGEFAGANSVFVTVANEEGTAITDQEAQVQQQNSFENGPYYDPRTAEWVPLMAGCTQIQLINNGSSTLYFAVIWGIDG